MANSEELVQGADRWTSRVIVHPTPSGQHTGRFTPARAGVVAIGAVFTLIGTFAIACRIHLILNRRRKAGYDDHAMFVAYGFAAAFTAAVFVSVRFGVGLELRDVPVHWGVRAVQAIYVDEVFYYVTIFCIKMSLMFLCLRLAAELRGWFYYASGALLVILVLHFMTTMVVVATQCIPVKKYWTPSTPGKCVDVTAFFYSANIFTIVTDVIMIALPVPIIWKIPGERRQKIVTLAAFFVAGGGTVASCVRLYSIEIFTASPQPMRDAAPISIWSFIEINLGILCASSAVIRSTFSKTRAPPPDDAGARQPRLPASLHGTIATTSSKVPMTAFRELKEYGRWSQSQASTAVTSPKSVKFPFNERELNDEDEKTSESKFERKSSLLPDPIRVPQKTPRGPQGLHFSALPQRPNQTVLHAMASRESSMDSVLQRLSHEHTEFSPTSMQNFLWIPETGEGSPVERLTTASSKGKTQTDW